MKTLFLYIFLLFAFANCKTNKPIFRAERLAGRYSQEDGGYDRLILSSNSAFLNYQPPDGHRSGSRLGTSDTLAYGTWSIESNGWIAVSSPPNLLKKLTMTVQEGSNSNLDTVYITINSPFQEDLPKHTLEPTIAVYAGTVLVMNAFLVQINFGNSSNVIKFYNPKKLPVQSLSLAIHPVSRYFDDFIPGNYTEGLKVCETETYGAKNPTSNQSNQSNQFVIYIPDLTEGFLKHRRLNRNFIKVIDQNHLEWDGHIFKRVSD